MIAHATDTQTLSNRIRSTWVLQRRRTASFSLHSKAEILHALRGGRAVGGNMFVYGHQSTLVRPTAARLLAALWQATGDAIDIEHACEQVYGRPATLRAMRQTAFRASRALDRVNCPLVVGCRNACVFLRRRDYHYQVLSSGGSITPCPQTR